MIEQHDERKIVLTDSGFYSKDSDPTNMKICKKGEWSVRMLAETVLLMMAKVCYFEWVRHRV